MITIRSAEPSDAAGLAKIKVDGWQTAFKGIVPQPYLDSLNYPDQEERLRKILSSKKDRSHELVAVTDTGSVAGFAATGPNRSPVDDYDGELMAIYVSVDAKGQGIGSLLFAASVKQLKLDGFRRLIIWCLDGNPHCRFYTKLGGKVVGEKWDDIGGACLKQYGYGWRDLDMS